MSVNYTENSTDTVQRQPRHTERTRGNNAAAKDLKVTAGQLKPHPEIDIDTVLNHTKPTISVKPSLAGIY